ncbi:MAG TPA: TrkA family potassium uptake protein [Anaerolineae bacterium]|nr:TrkA family potassium uptake protein [Anaerolineae bacterium]HRV92657.1 TrkA family potassium uptake protein [Anaerolineae bacterium]
MSNQKASLASRIVNNVKNLLSLDSRPRLARSNHTNSRHEFIIVGLGRFGTSLAMALTAYNHQVLAIDLDKKRVQQVAHLLPHVVQMDATDIDALREVGAESFDTGIICTGSVFEANLLATVNLRKLGVRRVISKARTVTQQEILQRVGADEVILPEHEAGVRLARRLAAIDFVDFLELSHDTGVVEIVAPEQLIGKSLVESEVRARYGISVIAIKRGNDVVVSPRANEIINENDILVVLGKISDCERLQT